MFQFIQKRLSKLFVGGRVGNIINFNSRNMSGSASDHPKSLTGFGYDFNSDSVLKKLDKDTGKITDLGFEFENQEHYEALGEAITEYVYDLLLKNGMHKIFVPEDIPSSRATFIFTSKECLDRPQKLLILIHGSGVVRAGQWSRSLIINQSLNHGTQIPYIKKANELGFDVLITNTNDNSRVIDGKLTAIPKNKDPSEHAINVWEKYVIGSNPEAVAIVAHSYGGAVTADLARKFPKYFKDKVFAIGFTDSVHSVYNLNEETLGNLRNIARNYVTSSKPLNELISKTNKDIPRYSAGHAKHEWTSYSSMDAIFDFFNEKYEDFEKTSKKPRLEL